MPNFVRRQEATTRAQSSKAEPRVAAGRDATTRLVASSTIAPALWPLNAAGIVGLQRLAGNATVTALLTSVQRALPADIVAQEPVAMAPPDPVVDIVLDIVEAASPLAGTAQAHGIWGLIRRQFTNRHARSQKASKKTDPLAVFKNVLYDKGLANRINKLKKPQKQKALEHIFGFLGAAADVKAEKAAAGEAATTTDEFTEVSGSALGTYIKSEEHYRRVRAGLLGAFGALEVGTRPAIKNAANYYGSMVAVDTFIDKKVGGSIRGTTDVHPDMAKAIGLAEKYLTELREKRAAQMNPRAASWWFKGLQNSVRDFGEGVEIRANANNALELSLHSYGWAIDVNASMNPNVPAFPRGLVKELTGVDVFASSTGQTEGNFAAGKTAADVRNEAERLRKASQTFKGTFQDEDSLKAGMLRIINGRLGAAWTNAEIDLIYPLVTAAIEAGKDQKKKAEKIAARTAALDALNDQIRNLQETIGPAVGLRAGQFQRANLAQVLIQMGGLYIGSFTGKVSKKTGVRERVKPSAIATNLATVATHGFMNLDTDLVAALAGAEGGGLNWLGAVDEKNTKDFMHFELMNRPSLYPTVQRQLAEVAGGSTTEPKVTVQRLMKWPGARTKNIERHVRGGEVIRYPISGLTVGNQDPDPNKAAVETAEGRAIALVPAKLAPGTEVDILFHLHGHYIGWREGAKTDKDMGATKGEVRDEGEEGIVDGLPPDMIAILPQGTTDSDFGSLDVTSYAEAALNMVPKWEGAKPRQIVLSAHSGGGGTLNPALGPEKPAKLTTPKKDETKKQKEARESASKRFDDDWQSRQAHPAGTRPAGLREVTLFDAINGPHELSHATVWVTDNIKADIAALESKSESEQSKYLANSVRFRAYYSTTAHRSYVKRHEALQGSIDEVLGPTTRSPKISQPVWDVLFTHYTVSGPIEIGHNLIVRTNLVEALQARSSG